VSRNKIRGKIHDPGPTTPAKVKEKSDKVGERNKKENDERKTLFPLI
jgi:hypothetical protein